VDQHARLLALEFAFKALAETLHGHRAVRLEALADAMESRAGLLAMAGDPALAGVRDALDALVRDLRETAAELGADDG
jgi:hypothetical protein